MASLSSLGPINVEHDQSCTNGERNCVMLDLCMSNLSALGPMGVELEQSLTYDCSTRAILHLRVWRLSSLGSTNVDLGPVRVELEQSGTCERELEQC